MDGPMTMHATETIDGVNAYTLESGTEFFDLTKNVFSALPAFVFRGQANYSWSLRSGLDRLQERFPRRWDFFKSEFADVAPLTDEQQLGAFKRAVRGRRGPNPVPLSYDGYW